MGDTGHLELRGIQSGDVLRIVVAGDLDLATTGDLRAAVDELAEPGMTVTLDLDELTFIDVVGLRELASLRDRAKARAWRLELAGIRARVRQVAELAGMSDALVFP